MGCDGLKISHVGQWKVTDWVKMTSEVLGVVMREHLETNGGLNKKYVSQKDNDTYMEIYCNSSSYPVQETGDFL